MEEALDVTVVAVDDDDVDDQDDDNDTVVPFAPDVGEDVAEDDVDAEGRIMDLAS